MDEESGLVYFLTHVDTDIIRHSLSTILLQLSNTKSPTNSAARSPAVVISSKRQLSSISTVQSFPQYFVSLCRRYNLLKNDRVTLLSEMDQLIALQLCLAERNKQERGDFDVETSVVLQAHKDIVNRKLQCHDEVISCEDSGIETDYQKFLTDSNCLDFCDVFNILKEECDKNEELRKELMNQTFLFLDVPKSKSEKKMLELICSNKLVKSVTVEVPLDSEQEINVAVSDSCLETTLDTVVPLSTVKKPVSITEAYVRLVYLSYLELLINSRSELALARVINVPERELTHAAFTDLKHEAKQKNMTMYQTATSYVMKIRLGGKGYAPDPNHALGQHIKGLGEFVVLMQKLEEVIEEDSNLRSACSRVVRIIRKEMIKCRDSKLRPASVESVAEQLQEQITGIIDILEGQIVDTPNKPACNGGSLTSRRARKALRHLLDKLATVDDDLSTLDHLTDIYSSQRTPIRFPSVLSQFRSPEEELEVTSPENKYNLSLSERVMNRQNKTQDFEADFPKMLNSADKDNFSDLLTNSNVIWETVDSENMTPIFAKRYKAGHDWAAPVHSADVQQEEDIFSQSQVYVIPSKTIVHAGTKFSSGEASKVLESILDQENVTESSHTSWRRTTTKLTDVTNTSNTNNNKSKVSKDISKETKAVAKATKVTKEKGTKRPLEGASSSQTQKKQKGEASKSCRRKLLPQVKGQQQLTKFFRV